MPDPKDKQPKRRIDRIRESAGSMNINVPGDDSEITGMLTLGDSLLVVKRKGIYQIKMADEIDPERTNANVPNTVQRLAAFGSDEEFIGKILPPHMGCSERTIFHLTSTQMLQWSMRPRSQRTSQK